MAQANQPQSRAKSKEAKLIEFLGKKLYDRLTISTPSPEFAPLAVMLPMIPSVIEGMVEDLDNPINVLWRKWVDDLYKEATEIMK